MTDLAMPADRRSGLRSDRSPRVAIFTVTMNRLDYTARTFDSLRRSTDIAFDHFVVDNGSTDGTKEYLKENSERFRQVVLNDGNTGLTNAWNSALDMIGDNYDFIIKVDNDCEFLDDGWLETLLDVSSEYGDRIILSPRVEGLMGRHRIEGGHERTHWVQGAAHTLGLTNHVGGICLFAPHSAYDGFRFGRTPMHGNIDLRFSMHVQLDLGYQLGYVEDVRVLHMDRTAGQMVRYPEYWADRPQQSSTVYGEHPLVTWLLQAPRRLALLRKMERAGLLDTNLPSYLLGRAARRFGPSGHAGKTPLEAAETGAVTRSGSPLSEHEGTSEGLGGDGS